MPAALHWTVIAVDATGKGRGVCGHRHATADEAMACPWDPERPRVCDLLVRQVRTEQPRAAQTSMPWARPERQARWRAA